VPKNQEEYRKNSAREGNDEHCLLNSETTSPELLAATFHELSTKSSCIAEISTTTTILATLSVVLPLVVGNSVNPATAFNSRNIATTTQQFVKTRIKFKTLELESLAIFRNNHANHKRVSHGIRSQEAKKQLLQVCEHHHQRWSSCATKMGQGANNFHRRGFQTEIRKS
jgi:hypothetical protein